LRIRIEKGFWTSKFGLTVLGIVFACFFTAAAVFAWYFVKYSRLIDARLSGNVLQNTTQIFSAPEHISPGQAWSPDDLTTYLTRVGYRAQNDDGALGQFTVRGNAVDIRPSKLSYFAGSNGLAVQFTGKNIRSIRPISGGAELGTAEIEPELITNLFDTGAGSRHSFSRRQALLRASGI
jgi:UvrB interaction domain